MKFNYRLSLYTGLMTALLSLNSCSDFLEEENKSNYTQENYFQTPEHAESSINTLYEQLRFITSGAGTYGESPFMALEFPTGLLNTEVGQSQFNRDLRTLSTNAENNYFSVWWQNSYEAIANANLAIQRIPEIQMNETDREHFVAEAKFMRAFHYFNLVRMFGDVPLILEPVDAGSELLYPERTDKAEVYMTIVTDLQEAEAADLPATNTRGRVTSTAVKTMLADVYLTMAGYPLQAGDEYYEMAAEKAKEIIDAGNYSLFDNYDALHDPAIKNTGELIFQSQYLAGANITNAVTQWLLPRARNISAYADEFGVMFPTRAFLDTYQNDDRRIEEEEFYYTSYPSYENSDQIVDFGTPYIYKFFDEDAVLRSAQSELNWTFYRYAEILLIYAEAGFEAYGATPEVLAAINQIRDRAELPDFDASITAEDIWTEGLHELAFENKYWFDMLRRRQVLNTETGNWENFVGHSFSYGPTLTEKYLLFAIPQREIDNNPKLEQNPGW